GDGTFDPHVEYASGSGSTARTLVVGDFNEDGKFDVIAGNSNSTASLLLGNGDGTFASWISIANTGSAVTTADLNGDHHLDLIVSGPGVLLGNGNGTFG